MFSKFGSVSPPSCIFFLMTGLQVGKCQGKIWNDGRLWGWILHGLFYINEFDMRDVNNRNCNYSAISKGICMVIVKVKFFRPMACTQHKLMKFIEAS